MILLPPASTLRAVFAVLFALTSLTGCAQPEEHSRPVEERAHPAEERAQPGGPEVPFEDIGACPFEGCVYREWIANGPVSVLTDRRPDARIAFTLKKGDHVQAITGIVITMKPGRVEFQKPADLWTTAGTLHVEPGDTLYLLTYQGEGASTAWFKGRLYDSVDGSGFLNDLCGRSIRCNGTVVERPQTTWWIRLRSQSGLTGWTAESGKFDNKDRLG